MFKNKLTVSKTCDWCKENIALRSLHVRKMMNYWTLRTMSGILREEFNSEHHCYFIRLHYFSD